MIVGAIALLSAVFGGSGATSFEAAYEPFVKQVVTDEQRYDQIMAPLKQLDQDTEALNEQFDDGGSEEIKTILSNYDSTKDDFRNFRRRFMDARSPIVQEFIDARFKMVSLMTEDEWNAMCAAAYAKAKDDE